MRVQNYGNHKRYYIPHHFILYPIVGIAIGYAFWAASQSQQYNCLWLFVALALLLVAFLSFMIRQHYALTLQNRIVRMELRFRYYILTHRRFETVEKQLSEKQVFALRFAPDEELVALVQRTLAEGLTADEIKKAIKNWLPDEHRV